MKVLNVISSGPKQGHLPARQLKFSPYRGSQLLICVFRIKIEAKVSLSSFHKVDTSGLFEKSDCSGGLVLLLVRSQLLDFQEPLGSPTLKVERNSSAPKKLTACSKQRTTLKRHILQPNAATMLPVPNGRLPEL